MDRRRLLASFVAVFAASVTVDIGAALAAAEGSIDSFTARELSVGKEFLRLCQQLIEATESGDFSAWDPGPEDERPERWRLARLIVELSGAHDRTPFEDSLLQRLDYCWARLTQPTWFAQAWKAELSALPPLDDDRPPIPFWPHPPDAVTEASPLERWAARFEEPGLRPRT
ncbi:MAG: hypothetical protein P4L98_04840 [Ancalomicrobiaceae bacterium]|nr:hypothetical protein [Ancalomicrobiaceae bacterium]